MDSITLYTEEIDNLNEAAAELFAQAESFIFKKNSMGIIFTEEDTDYKELYTLLAKRWNFPIMGCTAMAMFLGNKGYCDIGISMLLLTADDCAFSVGMTGEINKDNYKELLTSKYKELAAALPDKPKLILSYAGMYMDGRNVGGDDRVDTLSELGEGIPVYGGTAADSFNTNNIRVLYNGESTASGQVMALISGNISPKFICINSIENKRIFSYDVSKSCGNQVFSIGNQSFIDILRKEEMSVAKTNVFSDFLLSPFIVTLEKDGGDKVEAARSLSMLDYESGSGFFLGTVPEGSMLSIGIVNKTDVEKSVGLAIDGILKKMKESEQEFHTMLCTTCCARFLALAGNATAEVDSLDGHIPPSISLMGMYSNGEYCPVTGNVTGKEYNMFHNFTFTIMVF